MGQYCFARCHLSSAVVVCNAAGRQAGRQPGAWAVGRRRAVRVRVGGRAADTRQRAITVYVPLGRHILFNVYIAYIVNQKQSFKSLFSFEICLVIV